jgi:hypothetical protein
VPEASPRAIPRDLRRLLSRCLKEDPQQRFRVMDDVRLILEDLREDSILPRRPSGLDHRPPPPAAWKGPGVLFSLFLVLVAASVLTWWLTHDTEPPPETTNGVRLSRLTKDTSLAITPALSPDGRLFAYASDKAGEDGLDIWVQQVAGGPAIRLTQDDAAEYSPAFSPDGSRIVFRSDRGGGGLYTTPAMGGHTSFLASGGRRPRYSPDGNLVAYYAGPPGSYSGTSLYVVPTLGGEPKRLQPEFLAAASPAWTPDGKHLLFVGTRPGGAWDWWVTTIDGTSLMATGASDIFERQGLSGGPPGPDAWVDGN